MWFIRYTCYWNLQFLDIWTLIVPDEDSSWKRRTHYIRYLRGYYYHWVDTFTAGLSVPKGIIRPVVSVSITGSIPLLVDYQSPRVLSAQ